MVFAGPDTARVRTGRARGKGRGRSAVVTAMGPDELEAAQLWSVAGLGLFIGIAALMATGQDIPGL